MSTEVGSDPWLLILRPVITTNEPTAMNPLRHPISRFSLSHFVRNEKVRSCGFGEILNGSSIYFPYDRPRCHRFVLLPEDDQYDILERSSFAITFLESNKWMDEPHFTFDAVFFPPRILSKVRWDQQGHRGIRMSAFLPCFFDPCRN